ncbi:MAG: hypothetical protein IIY78_10375 [Clostridia bacterium]|nr:hypothetical protein [Clostridia bacterium]
MDEEFDMPQSEENESEIIRERHERRRAKRRRIHKRRKIIRRVLFGVFLLFLMTYFSMVLYTSNFSVMETEQADFFEYNDGLDVEAFAVRSEEYITNSKKGIISYTVDDGEKINAGGSVARLFGSEVEVENWQRYNDINNELTLLRNMTGSNDSLFVDLDTVDVQIQKKITDFKNDTAQNKLTSVNKYKLNLLRLFNERTVVTGGSANFNSRIDELQSQLDEIRLSEGLGRVKSKHSGFFSSRLDGFENSFDYSKAESMKADDVKKAVRKDPPSDAVGRVITTINWYLLCPVTGEQALTIASGDRVVSVSIPRVMSGSIPATVIGVNQSSAVSDGLLVLKSDYMDGTLADIRRENISIKTYTYKGLRISRSAIHDDYISVQDYDEAGNAVGEPHDEKVQGVYVLYGKRLEFVQVKIIYSDNDFVICSDDTTDKELLNGKTIKLHDTVVVRGKELYSGKIVR